ncbi:MAG: fasciclin domain-containing protein [Micromonosporaceae bacterium]
MLLHKTGRALAVAGITALLAAGCAGTDGTDDAGADKTSAPAATSEAPADAMGGMVGPGCADYAEKVPDGDGSVEGMAEDPVATAASNNPLLTTLTAAVSGELNPKVDLVDTLNGAEFTVFAPVDTAFEKVPAETIEKLKTDDKLLTTVLTYHVVPGQIAPDAIAGEQTSVQGGKVTVTGSGDSLKVNDANVICGGVKTANATVYLIDTVLMPEM